MEVIMKYPVIVVAFVALFLLHTPTAVSQEKVLGVEPASEAAEGLDLNAVGALFEDSKSLEEFEKSLNDPATGINNLDLDEDGNVDFIRVVEEASDGTHLIILQVPLGKNEFQDVATIEVEQKADDYAMQVHGNDVIYGENYYVAPIRVRVNTWPIIAWIYRPAYRPYRSVYVSGHYPRWWKPYHPVRAEVYRTRAAGMRRGTFALTRTAGVRSVTKVKYRPHTSTLVKRQTTITRTKAVKKKTVTKTKVKRRKR
jgi:hypothetical protein